jgi:D-alanyl-lipoteichoic acid acyltransferase DltB (MBOAT superfamily)
MIFNSITFIVFLALAVCLYWALSRRPRLWMVFLASLTFYGFWRVEFLPLLLVSTATDYWAARLIHASASESRRKRFLALSLVVNLGLLFYFKYLLFFAGSAVGLLNLLGLDIDPPRFSIILPLGISFYTFQTISYTIDVYRKAIRPERDFVLYACYVTFFPQLVAGPILRAKEVIGQLSRRPAFASDDLVVGIRRLLFGLFLKVGLADNLAPLVEGGYSQPLSTLGALDVWTLAFLFGFQIYFDFAGYSHIALGCARMMGIRFPENFAFPYLATSPSEFWRRWHISLSSWVRDYIYLPLIFSRARGESKGGMSVEAAKKQGRRRVTRAIFVTFAAMGIWHGANWTFLAWGLFHGLILYVEQQFAPLKRRTSGLGRPLRAAIGWLATMPLLFLGNVVFRCESIGVALRMYAKLLVPRQYLVMGLNENNYLIAAVIMLGIFLAYASARVAIPFLQRNRVVWAVAQTAVYGVVIVIVFTFLRPMNQFIYFQF